MEPKSKELSGEDLKNEGIERSKNNADASHNGNWSQVAYKFLVEYIRNPKVKTFMTEDIRMASGDKVPEPPSLRAWGSIIVRASKEGLIQAVGYNTVSNPRAHKAFARVWKVNR